MATREKRLAQFDGNGDPPPNQPLEVLCEDHSGTYQLPFACRWIAAHTQTRTIVDPFCGHGTVLAVANALGMDAIGVEIGKERARIARAMQVTLADP